MPRLLTLRLELNSFTGKIGPFSFLPSGSILDFNVSNNFLYGEIPASFSLFPESSFSGNKNLCGKPMALDCFQRAVESEPAKPGGFYGGGGGRDEVMVVFDGCKDFGDVDDLLKSSAELLGKGCQRHHFFVKDITKETILLCRN
ncbi:hypothetical protein OIU79_011638 [Salix purpurea]|uniref:Uncharacterized protein n=1 Tax=Salix purpurea TaxID=77065 RepID=A0A9Q0Q1U3_SALPP|nr:hypothetical protein OIU79_011638 [Salix purpurea]